MGEFIWAYSYSDRTTNQWKYGLNVTDSAHTLFLSEEGVEALRVKFENGGYGYKQAKDDLLETIMKWRAGKKEVFDDLMAHPEKITIILEKGGKKAKLRAQETMAQVRKKIGLQ